MKKFVCSVCGYVHEGDTPPEFCPLCKAPASKFVEQAGERQWAAEHVVGVAEGAPQDIIDGLRMNFNGECNEVGMYLAMARQRASSIWQNAPRSLTSTRFTTPFTKWRATKPVTAKRSKDCLKDISNNFLLI